MSARDATSLAHQLHTKRQYRHLHVKPAAPAPLRAPPTRDGLRVVVAAFLSAPTFAVWCLAFFNAKPAWREDDDAEGGMENDMMPELGVDLARGVRF